MANSQTKVQELKGLNIYHDRRHGTVMYDVLTKNGYVILNRDVKKLVLNDLGFPVAILVYFLSQNLKVDSYVGPLAAIAAYILCKLLFRFLYLYKLPVIKNYEPEGGKKGFIERFASIYNKTQLIIVAVLAIAIFIASMVMIYLKLFTGINMICMGIMGIAALCLGIISLLAIKQLQENQPTNKGTKD